MAQPTVGTFTSRHMSVVVKDGTGTPITATLGPDRVICVAKEVTKLHETFLTGRAAELEARLAQTSLKGEFVLLIAPADFVL